MGKTKKGKNNKLVLNFRFSSLILIRIFRTWFFVLAASLQAYFRCFLFLQCCVVASKLLLEAIILQWCLIYYFSYWWHCFIAFLGVVWVCHYSTSLWREGRDCVFVNKNTHISYIHNVHRFLHTFTVYVHCIVNRHPIHMYTTILCVYFICVHTLCGYIQPAFSVFCVIFQSLCFCSFLSPDTFFSSRGSAVTFPGKSTPVLTNSPWWGFSCFSCFWFF